MAYLLKIAWRNVWRNKIRSFVVISAISVGIWSLIFLLSFSRGLIMDLIDSSIRREVGHMQIAHPDFIANKEGKFFLAGLDRITAILSSAADVKHVAPRMLVQGMASSAQGARGVQIWGVLPEAEAQVGYFSEIMESGDFKDGQTKDQVLISRQLAEKLHLKLKSKLVLTFQDMEGNITAGAFRICGLFDSGTAAFDETTVVVNRSDLQPLFMDEHGSIAHYIAVFVEHTDNIENLKAIWEQAMPGLSVRTYKEIAPEFSLYESQTELMNVIVIAIFMLALVFGIVNTMLMAVLERVKELGILKAIGMNRRRVFFMVMMETIFLSVIAIPIGVLIAYVSLLIFGQTGIDLSIFSEGMREFGMSPVIYPRQVPSLYYKVSIAVVLTAFFASLYPGWKATRLQPIDALTKI